MDLEYLNIGSVVVFYLEKGAANHECMLAFVRTANQGIPP